LTQLRLTQQRLTDQEATASMGMAVSLISIIRIASTAVDRLSFVNGLAMTDKAGKSRE